MRLHFPSVAIGVVAVALILVSMGQSAPATTAAQALFVPAARDMVRIADGVPYTVPTGRIFVLTAIGNCQGKGACTVQVDGRAEVYASAQLPNVGTSMVPVPIGFSVPAGGKVSVTSEGAPGAARAWGYLAAP